MFNAIPIKIPMKLYTKIEKAIVKIHMKTQKTSNSKAILSKKFKAGGITIPNFKIYYRVITMKTAWHWHKNRQEDQWIRIEDPDINPHIYSLLIFGKGAQNTRRRKDSLFNKCCWENWISACSRLKLDPCLSPCTKINSKWIKDLDIRPKTLKQLQEAVGNTLKQIGIGNYFLNRTQKAQHPRETMKKWNCIKLKSFCTAKETITRLKRQPTEWEKIFDSYSSDKGLIPRIYREHKNLSPQRINTPMKKWARELNSEFSKEEVQMPISTRRSVQLPQLSKRCKSKQHLDFISLQLEWP
jgi:uncharacterized protein (DUF736 family)